MKNILIISIAIITFGCASTGTLTPEQRFAFSQTFSEVNEMVAKKYFRNLSTYNGLTQNYYEMMLDMLPLNEKSEAFRKNYRYFDVRRIETFEKGMIVCVYSNYFKTGLCDNTRCPGTEQKEVETVAEFDTVIGKLASYTCPNSKK